MSSNRFNESVVEQAAFGRVTAIREALLPKLISGELRVFEVERVLEAIQ